MDKNINTNNNVDKNINTNNSVDSNIVKFTKGIGKRIKAILFISAIGSIAINYNNIEKELLLSVNSEVISIMFGDKANDFLVNELLNSFKKGEYTKEEYLNISTEQLLSLESNGLLEFGISKGWIAKDDLYQSAIERFLIKNIDFKAMDINTLIEDNFDKTIASAVNKGWIKDDIIINKIGYLFDNSMDYTIHSLLLTNMISIENIQRILKKNNIGESEIIKLDKTYSYLTENNFLNNEYVLPNLNLLVNNGNDNILSIAIKQGSISKINLESKGYNFLTFLKLSKKNNNFDQTMYQLALNGLTDEEKKSLDVALLIEKGLDNMLYFMLDNDILDRDLVDNIDVELLLQNNFLKSLNILLSQGLIDEDKFNSLDLNLIIGLELQGYFNYGWKKGWIHSGSGFIDKTLINSFSEGTLIDDLLTGNRLFSLNKSHILVSDIKYMLESLSEENIKLLNNLVKYNFGIDELNYFIDNGNDFVLSLIIRDINIDEKIMNEIIPKIIKKSLDKTMVEILTFSSGTYHKIFNDEDIKKSIVDNQMYGSIQYMFLKGFYKNEDIKDISLTNILKGGTDDMVIKFIKNLNYERRRELRTLSFKDFFENQLDNSLMYLLSNNILQLETIDINILLKFIDSKMDNSLLYLINKGKIDIKIFSEFNIDFLIENKIWNTLLYIYQNKIFDINDTNEKKILLVKDYNLDVFEKLMDLLLQPYNLKNKLSKNIYRSLSLTYIQNWAYENGSIISKKEIPVSKYKTLNISVSKSNLQMCNLAIDKGYENTKDICEYIKVHSIIIDNESLAFNTQFFGFGDTLELVDSVTFGKSKLVNYIFKKINFEEGGDIYSVGNNVYGVKKGLENSGNKLNENFYKNNITFDGNKILISENLYKEGKNFDNDFTNLFGYITLIIGGIVFLNRKKIIKPINEK